MTSRLVERRRRYGAAQPSPGRPAAALLVLATSAYLVSQFAVVRAAFVALSFSAPLLFLFVPRAFRLSRRVPMLLVAVVGWVVATIGWSADPATTGRFLIDIVAMAVLGFCTGSILGVEGARRALSTAWKLLLGACAVSLLVAPGWASAPDVDAAPGWHGVIGHKNGLGGLAVLALITFWFEPRTPALRRWAVLALVLLVGSRSSTALAVTIVLVGLLAWQAALDTVRARALRWLLAGSTAVLVVGGVVAFLTRIDIFGPLLGRDPTLSGRTEIWAAVWRAIRLQPVEGQGLGGVWAGPTEPTATIWKELRFEAFHAHNGYLDLVLQLGVVGAALFLLFVVATVVTLARRGDRAGRWGVVTIVVLCLYAMSESGPFLNEGFLVLSVLACAAAQRPIPPPPRRVRAPAPQALATTPAPARLSSSSA